MTNHNNLIHSLNGYAKPAKADRLCKGKRIYLFNKNGLKYVYFVAEGDFFLKSSENDKIISVISAPFVIGAMPSLEPMPVYIEMIDYGKILSIEYDFFWSLVNNKSLYSDAMKVISGYHTDLMKFINTHNECTETYVRALVERWDTYPCHIKKRFSLLFYIVNSSFISKSTASRIVKKLKEKGCVFLQNGKLVAKKEKSPPPE